MKLLLTSAGITTQAIADSLQKMVSKGNKRIGFITTAANAEPGNKDWYLNQLTNLQKYGYGWIDIIDPSAPGVDWRARLAEVGIVFVSGGNTFHLLDQARKTGFDAWLKNNLETIVYIGASAGSILATPTIGISPIDDGDENLPGITDLTGLNFVNFEVSPHTTEMVSVKANETYAKTIPRKLYAYNDRSAISIIGDRLELIADGRYWEFN